MATAPNSSQTSPRDANPGESRFVDLLRANAALLKARFAYLTDTAGRRALARRLGKAFGDTMAHHETIRIARAAFGYRALQEQIDDAVRPVALQSSVDLPKAYAAIRNPMLVAPLPLLGDRALELPLATIPGQPSVSVTPAPLDREGYSRARTEELLAQCHREGATPVPCFFLRQGLLTIRLSVRPLVGPATVEVLEQALDDAVRENPAMYDWFEEPHA